MQALLIRTSHLASCALRHSAWKAERLLCCAGGAYPHKSSAKLCAPALGLESRATIARAKTRGAGAAYPHKSFAKLCAPALGLESRATIARAKTRCAGGAYPHKSSAKLCAPALGLESRATICEGHDSLRCVSAVQALLIRTSHLPSGALRHSAWKAERLLRGPRLAVLAVLIRTSHLPSCALRHSAWKAERLLRYFRTILMRGLGGMILCICVQQSQYCCQQPADRCEENSAFAKRFFAISPAAEETDGFAQIRAPVPLGR